jgi:hypothetical protein
VQGAQQYQQGPGLVDKLQQPQVKGEIVKGVGLFAAAGIGMLLLAFLPSAIVDEGLVFTIGAALVTIGVGPVIAVIVGRDFGDLQVERNTALAASYITGAAGYFVFAILALIGVQISDVGGSSSGVGSGASSATSSGLGDLFLPLILGALMVGAAAVAATYFEQNY